MNSIYSLAKPSTSLNCNSLCAKSKGLGITLKAMGFPTSMFHRTVRALARTVGWIAQWEEMIEDPSQKIGRPRQLYTGDTHRNYLPIGKRK